MSIFMQDLRYALRTMARNPGFTIVALIILTLGIGANSALFSVVHSVLLDPLPYPDSDRLIQVGRELPMGRSNAVSATQFLFWEEHNRSFEMMTTYDGQGGGTNLVEGDRPEFIPALRVSSGFFKVLGTPPQIGRDFAPEDGVDGAAKVAMISDGLWRRRFGGDPLVLGRVLRLSGVNHTVIGVAARGFQFNTHGDIWTPLTLVYDPQDRGAVYYVVARLKPEATVQSAQADMTAVAERLRAELPDTMGEREKVFVRPHLEQVVGSVRPAPDGGRDPGRAQWRLISNDYFRVMGIPLRRGRTFTDLDTQGSERVAIINDALARRYFPDEDPIGQSLVSTDPGSDDPPTRIVGLVGDVRELALDRPATPTMFVPAAQEADENTVFIANILLLLAVAGIYGVMSYSVAQRTHEIGVRMALGAARGATLRLILGQGMRLAAIGVVVGILGAFALTRLMQSLLFEISATDPLVFLLVASVLLVAAAVACIVPALRASRVDPLIAMRSE